MCVLGVGVCAWVCVRELVFGSCQDVAERGGSGHCEPAEGKGGG